MSKIDRTAIDDFNADRTLTNLKTVLSAFNIEDYPICEDCNEPILYRNTKFRLRISGEAYHEGSQKLVKTINSVNYHIKICEACLRPQLSERTLRKTRWFNAYNDAVRISCRISQEEIDSANSTKAITLENMQRKYGQEDGQSRYDEYRRKQAETNTFEYKRDKYGWTKEQFDEFNLSRASTKENFIKRHGEKAGAKMWDGYCKRQSETSTNEYMLSTQDAEYAKYIHEAKKQSLKYCQLKYGEWHGQRVYDEMYAQKHSSIAATTFFDSVMTIVYELSSTTKITSMYGHLRDELVLNYTKPYTNKRARYCYDFCIPELKFIVEFHGDLIHANPKTYADGSKSYHHPFLHHKPKEEIWARDAHKKKLAEDNGYHIEIVWESERNERLQEIVDIIVKKLNIKNTNTKNLQK